MEWVWTTQCDLRHPFILPSISARSGMLLVKTSNPQLMLWHTRQTALGVLWGKRKIQQFGPPVCDSTNRSAKGRRSKCFTYLQCRPDFKNLNPVHQNLRLAIRISAMPTHRNVLLVSGTGQTRLKTGFRLQSQSASDTYRISPPIFFQTTADRSPRIHSSHLLLLLSHCTQRPLTA